MANPNLKSTVEALFQTGDVITQENMETLIGYATSEEDLVGTYTNPDGITVTLYQNGVMFHLILSGTTTDAISVPVATSTLIGQYVIMSDEIEGFPVLTNVLWDKTPITLPLGATQSLSAGNTTFGVCIQGTTVYLPNLSQSVALSLASGVTFNFECFFTANSGNPSLNAIFGIEEDED